MTDQTTGRPLAEADRLILDAATGGRLLGPEELDRVVTHVAHAGFRPSFRYPVGGRLEGLVWQGRPLARSELVTVAEAHFLRRVVARQEWPIGTTLDHYLDSIRAVTRDPGSGLLVSRWHDRVWHLSIVRRSGVLRGPRGYDWLAVEYDVAAGYWATAFQVERGLAAYAADPRRREPLWLRQPS
jgi:hypothetical protein